MEAVKVGMLDTVSFQGDTGSLVIWLYCWNEPEGEQEEAPADASPVC